MFDCFHLIWLVPRYHQTSVSLISTWPSVFLSPLGRFYHLQWCPRGRTRPIVKIFEGFVYSMWSSGLHGSKLCQSSVCLGLSVKPVLASWRLACWHYWTPEGKIVPVCVASFNPSAWQHNDSLQSLAWTKVPDLVLWGQAPWHHPMAVSCSVKPFLLGPLLLLSHLSGDQCKLVCLPTQALFLEYPWQSWALLWLLWDNKDVKSLCCKDASFFLWTCHLKVKQLFKNCTRMNRQAKLEWNIISFFFFLLRSSSTWVCNRFHRQTVYFGCTGREENQMSVLSL